MRIVENVAKCARGVAVAFSIYSRIPAPRFAWTEDDVRRSLVFFPFVGAVVGAAVCGFVALFRVVEIPLIARIAIVAAIPLTISGGFHVDGFMDVQDALKSYRTREEKLRILKDPHVGAFAVVGLLTLASTWTASLAIALSSARGSVMNVFALSFFVVRAACGATALKLRRARPDGMLNEETRGAGDREFWILVVQVVLGVAATAALDPICGSSAIVALGLFTLWYRRVCYREFGGVTGDCCGYYVAAGESVALAAAAAASLFAG